MAKSELVNPEIFGKLRRLRRTIRARLAGEALAWLLIALAGLVFVTFAFDYLLRLDRTPRAVIMSISLAGVAWVLYRFLLAPMRVAMDPQGIALLIERHYGLLDDRLVSAIQFSRTDPDEICASRAMIERVAEEANRIAQPLNFNEVVETKGLWRASGLAGCIVAVLVAFAVWQGGLMGLWFRRNVLFADDPWPQSTYLKVLGGQDFTVVRGEDLTITVEAAEESLRIPSTVTLHAHLPSVGDARIEMNPVAGSPRRFEKTFEAVSESFSFYVTGGDDQSDRARPHRVRIVDPPELTNAEFTVEYPAYTSRASRRFEAKTGTSVLTAPLGSRITITGRSTKDLKRARIVVECESLRVQRRIRKDLRDAIGRQADVCEKLDSALKALAGGKVSPSLRTELRRCAGLRGAVDRRLAEIAADESAIVDELDKNPPDGADAGVPIARLRERLLRPLVELSSDSRALNDKVFESLADSNVPAAGMRRRLAATAEAQKKLLERMRSFEASADDIMRRVEKWMSQVTLRVLPMKADGRTAPRSVMGRFYLWGRNRSEAIMLRVVMTDSAGVTNRSALECPVRIDPDLRATVDLKKHSLGAAITPNAILPLSIDVKDDYGIAGVGMKFRVKSPSARTQPTSKPIEGDEPLNIARRGSVRLRAEYSLDLKGRGLSAGQFISVWAEAFDTLPVEFGGPNVGQSASQTFRIITPAEMFDSLIARQKQVRVEYEQAIYMQNRSAAKAQAASQELSAGAITDDARRRLAEAAALQGTVNAECAKAAGTLRAILEEMRNNRVGTDKDYDELENKVIVPIAGLLKPMTEVTAIINNTRSIRKLDELKGRAAKISKMQLDLLDRMRSILKDMQKLQNRQELASKLKRLLKGWEGWLNKAQEESDRLKSQRLEGTTEPAPSVP